MLLVGKLILVIMNVQCHDTDLLVQSFSESDLVKQIASTDEAEDTRLAIDPSYARLITIRSGKPSGNSIKDSLAVEEVVKRVSLSEPQLEKVAKAHPDALIL